MRHALRFVRQVLCSEDTLETVGFIGVLMLFATVFVYFLAWVGIIRD